MKRETYLMTCSRNKMPKGNLHSTVSNLSFNNLLGRYRKRLITEYENIYGPLNWYECMPAIDRYDGPLLYTESVKNAIKNNSSQVLIISALFGIVKPSDLIPNYNLIMTDTLNKLRINNFWRTCQKESTKGILNEVLISNKLNSDITYVSLLSKPYQMAFDGFTQTGKIPSEFVPNLILPPSIDEIDFKDRRGHWKKKYLIKRL